MRCRDEQLGMCRNGGRFGFLGLEQWPGSRSRNIRKRSQSKSRFFEFRFLTPSEFSWKRKFPRTSRDKNRNTLVKGRPDRDYSNVKRRERTESNLRSGLGAAIRCERSILRISQGELAKRSGLHRTYVSDLERGARNPSIDSIEKLARALHVSVVKLFERAGNGDGMSRTSGSNNNG